MKFHTLKASTAFLMINMTTEKVYNITNYHITYPIMIVAYRAQGPALPGLLV